RAGTSAWAGILNTHWWVDPTAGVAGVLATQLLPFMDPGLIQTYDAFVRAAARGR
ncbi:1,4-butanediol diacrylate esterase, partial [Amaricoccus sp. HAR-UPW-R2A-40]